MATSLSSERTQLFFRLQQQAIRVQGTQTELFNAGEQETRLSEDTLSQLTQLTGRLTCSSPHTPSFLLLTLWKTILKTA